MFGKKKPRPQSDAQPKGFGQHRAPVAAEQRQHVIPEELFDTNTSVGRMLDEIGFKADDPSNLIDTVDDIQNKINEAETRTQKFIDRLNEQMPGSVVLKPFYMLPVQCWQGEHQNFLFRSLDVTPYTPWNVLPLPADDMSAVILDMKKHPGGIVDAYIHAGEKLVGDIHARFSKVINAVDHDIKSGGMDSLDHVGHAREQAIRSLMGVAMVMADNLFGRETLAKSRKMFYGEDLPQ